MAKKDPRNALKQQIRKHIKKRNSLDADLLERISQLYSPNPVKTVAQKIRYTSRPAKLNLADKTLIEDLRQDIQKLSQGNQELPQKIAQALEPYLKQNQPANTLPTPQTTGTTSISLQPPITVAPEEVLLAKYKLDKWNNDDFTNAYSGVAYHLETYSEKIIQECGENLDLLKKAIELARKLNWDPTQYAPFVTAGLDDNWGKSKIPGLEFTEKELEVGRLAG